MKLSKILVSLLSVLLLAGLFAGYSSKGPDAPAACSDPKEVGQRASWLG
ncbi:hypothetical protein ACFQ5D_18930 [Paenibacillus farraposensis]|uniref:Uncharacterized protein n=1 Tax=Paenibacillus farraposensis TaxID=2807095 RepID=A0ABW4DFJ7_9BACL|nr:hypothetical protein [Paenibacillus farraposensis]MCC3379691.1 hypothetical protein [Paenibacillus farraposensis]